MSLIQVKSFCLDKQLYNSNGKSDFPKSLDTKNGHDMVSFSGNKEEENKATSEAVCPKVTKTINITNQYNPNLKNWQKSQLNLSFGEKPENKESSITETAENLDEDDDEERLSLKKLPAPPEQKFLSPARAKNIWPFIAAGVYASGGLIPPEVAHVEITNTAPIANVVKNVINKVTLGHVNPGIEHRDISAPEGFLPHIKIERKDNHSLAENIAMCKELRQLKEKKTTPILSELAEDKSTDKIDATCHALNKTSKILQNYGFQELKIKENGIVSDIDFRQLMAGLLMGGGALWEIPNAKYNIKIAAANRTPSVFLATVLSTMFIPVMAMHPSLLTGMALGGIQMLPITGADQNVIDNMIAAKTGKPLREMKIDKISDPKKILSALLPYYLAKKILRSSCSPTDGRETRQEFVEACKFALEDSKKVVVNTGSLLSDTGKALPKVVRRIESGLANAVKDPYKTIRNSP
ncbi:MAG: hypothetical protein WC197_02985, partial [Candidatus Gastranaerophilaceae bacterium]